MPAPISGPRPSRAPRPASPQAAPPPIRYLGRHLSKTGPVCPAAALIRDPLIPEHRDAVYARLPREARHFPLLAKKWKLWGVYAIEEWAFEHLHSPRPPEK